jgi:hypothetical protein
LPTRRERSVEFDLPPLETAADAKAALAALAAAVAAGHLTPGEASEIGKLVEGFCRIVEASDFEERLKAIEERVDARHP